MYIRSDSVIFVIVSKLIREMTMFIYANMRCTDVEWRYQSYDVIKI